MKCHICASTSNLFSKYQILGKHDITYYQCTECGFVQTEAPYWLDEAYANVISESDTGLVLRNYYCSQKASDIISSIFDRESQYLDYGGGYGIFTSMMRELGFDFYWDDKFCNNLFAENFKLNPNNKYELVTAFELFEHFVNPLEEIEKILQFSKSILFSTEILPANNPKPGDWWYYVPHEGQHVSVYTLNSMQKIADKFNLNFYTSEPSQYGISLHLLTDKKISPDIFNNLCHQQLKTVKKQTSISKLEPIKVAFDITVLGLGYLYDAARTGVYRVTEQMLKGLIRSSEIIVYLCSSNPSISSSCREYLKNEFEDIDLPLFSIADLNLLNIPLYHSPFYPIPSEVNNCCKIITIYDLIPVKFPEFFGSKSKEDSFIDGYLKSVGSNDYISCISESTKRDVLEYSKTIPDSQVSVAHLAADKEKFYRCQDSDLIESVHQKYQIPKAPYLLSVCTLEPRKNLVHVIRSFLKLIKEKSINDLNLVLVGTKGWQYDEIFTELDSNENLKQRVIFTGFIPDEELAPLYTGALTFLYLSLYEGFGLPPLEAMQCGTPVITSNTSSLPEVVGEAGIMLDPNDVDGLCGAIFDIYSEPDLRELLSLKSLEQSEKFTWEKTLQETIKVYRLAIANEMVIPTPQIVIDGVFFQLYQTGIARVWKTLLEEWSATNFRENIIVLDRSNTAPKIPGIRYRQIPAFDVNNLEADRQMLQEICDEEGADVFTSTYYTTPISTPSMLMIYDMIPEVMGWNLAEPAWRGKVQAIEQASAYTSISENSVQDLQRFYPNTTSKPVTVTYCGVSNKFTPATPAEIQAFLFKYGIQKPYFLITGGHGSYKNTVLFFQAFAQLINNSAFDIVCTSDMPDEFRQFTQGSTVHHLRLNDEGLRLAYAGAVALVYPSKYEGFGLPIVEALACGCPVITCPTSSIPEVAQGAALYVQDQDVNGMVDALCEIQKPSVRQTLINKGLVQAQQFSWTKMAQQVGDILAGFSSNSLSSLPLQKQNLLMFPDWSINEELLSQELASAIAQIIQKPDLDSTALLLDVSNADNLEQVELILAGISMNLLMEQDLDISEHLVIAPVGLLSIEQWQELLPQINNLVNLPHEASITTSRLVNAGLKLPALHN